VTTHFELLTVKHPRGELKTSKRNSARATNFIELCFETLDDDAMRSIRRKRKVFF
jgi:hypothetical protein